jgi:hypothetical protein
LHIGIAKTPDQCGQSVAAQAAYLAVKLTATLFNGLTLPSCLKRWRQFTQLSNKLIFGTWAQLGRGMFWLYECRE